MKRTPLLILTVLAIWVTISLSCSRSGNINNAFSLVSYKYDKISEVTDTDSIEGEDAMYWRSLGSGILPQAIGAADISQLRDTLEKLGFVEFDGKSGASPRKAAHLKVTNENPSERPAGNYSVNRLTIQRFSPEIVVWKSFLAYYTAGAAHPRQQTRYVNYSVSNNRILTLNNIFRPGFRAPLTEMIRERLADNEDVFPDADIRIPDNFYLTESGITFVYDQYEIAPYSAGEIEVFFYDFEITDLFRPEIQQMILDSRLESEPAL